MHVNWTKKRVLDWFGDRGVFIKPSGLKKWLWKENKLYFIVKDCGMELEDTEEGMVDVTQTHRDDGSSIIVYEPDESIAIAESPLADHA